MQTWCYVTLGFSGVLRGSGSLESDERSGFSKLSRLSRLGCLSLLNPLGRVSQLSQLS